MYALAADKFIVRPTNYSKQMNQCLSCTHTKYPKLNYTVMGNFVDVKGHKFWVEKYGHGKPAVILFNGGGETNRQWNSVIPKIAKYTTVIAYDRQGLGRTPTIDLTIRTAKSVVENLQVILHKINIKPPYVLVGHSIGGLYVSYFARRYPKQVAGIVTLDGNNSYQIYWDHLNTKDLKKGSKKFLKLNTDPELIKKEALAKAKIIRSKKPISPQEYARLIEALEVAGKPESARQIMRLPPLPKVPLIAMTEGTGKGFYYWHASVKQYAQQVPCGVYQWVAHSGHHIMIDQPEIVNQAIRRVIVKARYGKREGLCIPAV
jgi:pimeloyl-ACP methyl ester carboxylesterase